VKKLAKDLAGLIGISRKETDLDTLAAALAEGREQIEAATRDREAAESAYRDRILDATPAELEKLQAAKARATVDLDRSEALVAALVTRIDTVRETQERSARQAIYDDAKAKVDAIRERLPVEYRKHALAIRGLLRDLAEAEVARERARPLQEEFGPIEDIERDPRGLGGLPEEIVDETEEYLWALDGRTEPLPEEKQGRVTRHGEPDRGYITRGGQPWGCTLRRFTRIRCREAISPPYNGGSLLRTVNLPAFHAYGDDFVTAERVRGADTALDHLSRDLREKPEHDRPVVERLRMERDPAPGERSMRLVPREDAA